MRFYLYLAFAGALLCGPAIANQRIPLSAAIAQCDKQSAVYANTLADRYANTPTQYKVDTRYRSCVFAKSGRYPPETTRKNGLRLSGSASIGIVFSD
jgi:hypothetical protein